MSVRGTTTAHTRNKCDTFIRRYTNKYLIRIRMLVITPYNVLSYKRDWLLAQKITIIGSSIPWKHCKLVRMGSVDDHGIREFIWSYMNFIYVCMVLETAIIEIQNMSLGCSCNKPSRKRTNTMNYSSIGFLSCLAIWIALYLLSPSDRFWPFQYVDLSAPCFMKMWKNNMSIMWLGKPV